MSDNIFNRLIDFRAGSQEEYDSLLNVGGVSEEDLYYVSREINYNNIATNISNLYIGTNLIGDAYNSQYIDDLSKRITNPIGLIPYGMTLGRLLTETGGSISKVIDMMLFTNRGPSIDECCVIAGFIPKIDVNGQWNNLSKIQNWISVYAEPFFDESKYEMFYDLQGTISTLFTIMLDPSKSAEEFGGRDTGIYTGRMFVAVPHRDGEGKDITTIVDKVFQKVYRGSGLTRNFMIYDTAVLDFGGNQYRYKIYLFCTDQNVISRANMEYYVTLE